LGDEIATLQIAAGFSVILDEPAFTVINRTNGASSRIVNYNGYLANYIKGLYFAQLGSDGLDRGFSPVPVLAEFSVQNGLSGYTRLPNGIIFQWMPVSVNAKDTPNSYGQIFNLPITFPNNFYGTVISFGAELTPFDGNIGISTASYGSVHIYSTVTGQGSHGCYVFAWGN
jgi:hypothetical protein